MKADFFQSFVIILVGHIALVSDALAYKVELHGMMTEEAAERSVLGQDYLWSHWGINRDSLPAESLKPESRVEWLVEQNEDFRIPLVSGTRLNYKRLMAFGADVEDTALDVNTDFNFGPDALESIWGAGVFSVIANANIDSKELASRAFNHFYNAQTGAKLPVGWLQPNNTSPDWSLEDRGDIFDQNRSYKDALSYFERGLTERSQSDRREYIAKTIHTLGHVVHHVQDMAQPQHSRMDIHCDAPGCVGVTNLLGVYDDRSLYEFFTQDLIWCGVFVFGNPEPSAIQCGDFRSIANPFNEVRYDDLVEYPYPVWLKSWATETIPLGSYPIVKNPARHFYLTEMKPRDFIENNYDTGIANFSSKNFLTTDTAFEVDLGRCSDDGCSLIDALSAQPDLPMPNARTRTNLPGGKYTETYVQSNISLAGEVSNPNDLPEGYRDKPMKYLGLRFFDNYTGELIDNSKLATHSIFYERIDDKAREVGYFTRLKDGVLGSSTVQMPTLTVNYFNLEQQAKLLIPRAVGYSAGMINYFFRYNMDVVFNSSTNKFIVTNNSEYDFYGELKLYYDRPGAARYQVSSSFYDTATLNLVAGKSVELSVNMDYYPDNADGFFLLAKGEQQDDLGGYTGLAGSGFNIPKPIEAMPCGGSTSYSGENIPYEVTMFMGTDAIGFIDVYFEPYSIPDALTIRDEYGNEIIDTGFISDTYRENYRHRYYQHGDYLTIQVTPNRTNQDTAWELSVSCPG